MSWSKQTPNETNYSGVSHNETDWSDVDRNETDWSDTTRNESDWSGQTVNAANYTPGEFDGDRFMLLQDDEFALAQDGTKIRLQ